MKGKRQKLIEFRDNEMKVEEWLIDRIRSEMKRPEEAVSEIDT